RPEVLTEMSDLTNEIHAHEEEVARLESLPIIDKQLRVLYVAVALHKGIPVIALSTAPVRHPVREPIEQSRRTYGGTVYHLYKNNMPDKTELISSILQSCEARSEVEQITKELRYWLEEQWLDAPDVSARVAILNIVQMALESASQPTRAVIQTSPIG